jgi:site-specific recombinase XerD
MAKKTKTENQLLTLLPIFDSLEFIKAQTFPKYYQASYSREDFEQAKSFLLSYKNNAATFNAYRREAERLLQWSWLIAKKSIRDLRRNDIEKYIEFCQSPSLDWISTKKVPRFIEKEELRIPNPLWRPFVATVTKAEYRQGKKPSLKKHSLSEKALREIFTITTSFYNFLIQENYTEINPVSHLRQKSHYFRKVQGKRKIRRLSELQWHYVIETAEKMAAALPEKHERTLFIMSALYGMYLRISELAANHRWTPTMNHFYQDHDGLWWFTTVGKGNKERQISVSDNMLKALRRYRKSLKLSPLPSPTDKSPLIPKYLGKGPITSTSHIRDIVQQCFDQTIERLKQDSFHDEADALLQATVHWIRHTGISEDVKHRPREHVRDDAGHSSSAITDKYIDIELRARHASAKKKIIKHED